MQYSYCRRVKKQPSCAKMWKTQNLTNKKNTYLSNNPASVHQHKNSPGILARRLNAPSALLRKTLVG